MGDTYTSPPTVNYGPKLAPPVSGLRFAAHGDPEWLEAWDGLRRVIVNAHLGDGEDLDQRNKTYAESWQYMGTFEAPAQVARVVDQVPQGPVHPRALWREKCRLALEEIELEDQVGWPICTVHQFRHRAHPAFPMSNRVYVNVVGAQAEPEEVTRG